MVENLLKDERNWREVRERVINRRREVKERVINRRRKEEDNE